jgi:calcineurin-like phosphoesterase family protein
MGQVQGVSRDHVTKTIFRPNRANHHWFRRCLDAIHVVWYLAEVVLDGVGVLVIDILSLTPGFADKIWFTADHHFGHANIIKYTNRPFASAEEMDAELVRRWNEVVKTDDVVFHLGDFTLGGWQDARKYFCQLKGKIGVLGNGWHHDKRWMANEVMYWSYNDLAVDILPPMVVLELNVGRDHPLAIVLCHYPLAEWDRKHHGAIHLHGHSHGKHKGEGLIWDVGVDANNFYPVSLENIGQRYESYHRPHDPRCVFVNKSENL